MEVLSFSLAFFTIDIYFKGGEKEGAGKVLKVQVIYCGVSWSLVPLFLNKIFQV
jgi:hypothetical protein